MKPDPIEETTAGGIVLPPTEKEKYDRAQQTGTVVAVGEFCWREDPAPWAKPGDRILFARYSGVHVDGEDGAQYRILNDEHVLGRVSETFTVSELKARTPI